MKTFAQYIVVHQSSDKTVDWQVIAQGRKGQNMSEALPPPRRTENVDRRGFETLVVRLRSSSTPETLERRTVEDGRSRREKATQAMLKTKTIRLGDKRTRVHVCS
jgi:hypothetical protein